jgi:hypothetical protein
MPGGFRQQRIIPVNSSSLSCASLDGAYPPGLDISSGEAM